MHGKMHWAGLADIGKQWIKGGLVPATLRLLDRNLHVSLCAVGSGTTAPNGGPL